MTLPSHKARLLGVAALSIAASSVSAQSILNLHGESVLSSGSALPGSNGASVNDFPVGAAVSAANTSVFTAPILNLDGTLFFRAKALQDSGLGIDGSNEAGLFLGRTNDDLHMVVRASDQAPGLPLGTLLRSSSATLGANGLSAGRITPLAEIVMFGSSLYDPVTPTNTPTTADSAYFWGPAGGLQLLAREGDLVPTLTNGEVYGALDPSNQAYLLNEAGKVVFRNQMQLTIGGVSAGNDAIVLYGTPGVGNLQTVLREGDAWAGVGAAGELLDRYSSNVQFPTSSVNLNSAGQILHDLHFFVPSGSAASTVNDRAVAVWTPTLPTPTDVIIARDGDQAPGMPIGALFADASAFSGFMSIPQQGLNKSGRVIFVSSLPVGPGGITAADDQAIFTATVDPVTGLVTSLLALMQREGDAAPASLGAGVLLGTVNNASLCQNDTGSLAFFASITGGTVTTADDTVMFLGTPGNLTVVAREGDNAPGLVATVNGPWKYQAIQGNPHLTSRNTLVWSQGVTDTVTNKTVWYCYTPQNGVRLFFDPADTWTTALGASTASSTSSAGTIQSCDTTSLHLNDNGDFAIQVNLPTPNGSVIMRGHCGSFLAKPSAVTAAGGTAQQFLIDGGPANGNSFYFVLATAIGTRPGFPSPIGPQQVPLNFDGLWTQLSISAVNSPLWVNTLGITDANGVGIGISGFVMPTGFPGFNGTTVHHAALFFDLSITSTFVTEPSALLLY